ncbi:hypothetical protein AURANDRAFT_32471 [Aureococcus anophagefferens]|uniref:Cytochrome b5 domain-containing protein 1 n=1 Tax=Aureococcus anophagefferens TaxID=44056 RepID=F0YK15_AURAN|nr:hypothetical protein AURANDRAFT_32471 [Aureococcus anophagefferens]EGB04547.1 hypothetical protein AURANDRAFT_32471 [Aureococcus anophagefferens]|eukprot:XP_009040798.1 hypothetical protein AURANDRAFT_32471 [Aureococcus anophagefferens]
MSSQLLPKQHGRRRRYYTPEEINAHNSADDAWFSLFHNVFDLTELIATHRSNLTQPLISNAGRDISHWFDGKTMMVKSYYSEDKGVMLPYVPMGRFLNVPPSGPTSEWSTELFDGIPWWKDERYVVGQLSKNVRKLRIVNVLTQQSDVLNVCGEETVEEIQTRYIQYNAHALCYTWKQLKDENFVKMDMSKTLEQSGIFDESTLFESMGIDEDQYIPVVHVYFNDDLTYD